MSIGNTGKRAQQIGQQQKSRYQVNYQSSAETPLLPPRRSTNTNAQRQVEAENNVIVDPPAPEPSIQRDVEVDEVSTQTATEETAGQGETPQISPEAVAKEVYAMLKRDIRLERQRRGKSRV